MTQTRRPAGHKGAVNRCLGCDHAWLDDPGQYAEHYAGCPNCGGRYWLWQNWASEWKK